MGEESLDFEEERESSLLVTILTTNSVKIGVNGFHKMRGVLWWLF
jgi:hypothetical protein